VQVVVEVDEMEVDAEGGCLRRALHAPPPLLTSYADEKGPVPLPLLNTPGQFIRFCQKNGVVTMGELRRWGDALRAFGLSIPRDALPVFFPRSQRDYRSFTIIATDRAQKKRTFDAEISFVYMPPTLMYGGIGWRVMTPSDDLYQVISTPATLSLSLSSINGISMPLERVADRDYYGTHARTTQPLFDMAARHVEGLPAGEAYAIGFLQGHQKLNLK
jgi:hypothetical protein